MDIDKIRKAQRVEACIADVMERFPTDSKDYYVEVHQHPAPLARQLERANDALIAEVERLRHQLANVLPPFAAPASQHTSTPTGDA